MFSDENTNVNKLMLRASEEIRKAAQNEILDQAIVFADNPIKRLIGHTVGKDPVELFGNITKQGYILITYKEKKYQMSLDIVDKDYMLDLGELKGNPQVKKHMIYLLNAVKLLFKPIKDYMVLRGPFDYMLHIDHNTTLFLDKDNQKRIGIMLL